MDNARKTAFLFLEKFEGIAQKYANKGEKKGGCGGDDELREEGMFCHAFLRTMDPERAAAESGRRDGFSALKRKGTQALLEEMRESAVSQIRKEDVIRRMAQLAFGRANDAVRLALHPELANPDNLDLSAVSEFKVTDKGVEVKLIDRLKALEMLHGLLESGGGDGAEDLYRALEDAANQLGGDWDDG
jgi:hypothetical protein